jgi:hypothetical protein
MTEIALQIALKIAFSSIVVIRTAWSIFHNRSWSKWIVLGIGRVQW